MATWVSVAAATVPASVAAFRTAAGVEVAWASEDGALSRLWLRGFGASTLEALRAVPTARQVRVTEEGLVRMLPDGSAERLPYCEMPRLKWRSIAEVLAVQLPEVEEVAAPELSTKGWQLIPTDVVQPAAALLTSVTHLAAFAKTAPQVRLERLRFCWVEGRTLVIGTPLPALPGEALWGEEHLRPVGLDFEHPKLLGRLAPKPYGARPGVRTLWQADGRYVVLHARAFEALGRDNVAPGQAAVVNSMPAATPPPLPS